VRQPVGGRVAGRVVECDRARVEALDGREERRLDALVVADHLVAADLLDARRVETTDDRDPLTCRGDDERSRPGAVHAGDQVEAGIAGEHRLADERKPEVDFLLPQDLHCLVELLLDEGRRGCHGGGR
jgi:hypothetical protein